MDTQRRFALIQVRVTSRERDRWRRVAAAEELRLVELVRSAVRDKVLELERHRLLTSPPPAAASEAAGR
jgi:hypothetical protein